MARSCFQLLPDYVLCYMPRAMAILGKNEFTSKEAVAPLMSLAAPLWFWKFWNKILDFGIFSEILEIMKILKILSWNFQSRKQILTLIGVYLGDIKTFLAHFRLVLNDKIISWRPHRSLLRFPLSLSLTNKLEHRIDFSWITNLASFLTITLFLWYRSFFEV